MTFCESLIVSVAKVVSRRHELRLAGELPMFRVSILHLLALTACLAVSLACLKYAGEVMYAVVTNVAFAILMIATVVAIAARGQLRAVAGGFAACMGIYLALLWSSTLVGHRHWATDKIARQLHSVMLTRSWLDERTGERFDSDPVALVGTRNRRVFIHEIEVPSEGHFIVVAHYLWAALFGYFGALFASWIYARRRHKRSTINSSPTLPAHHDQA
jgi:hypothetical protein